MPSISTFKVGDRVRLKGDWGQNSYWGLGRAATIIRIGIPYHENPEEWCIALFDKTDELEAAEGGFQISDFEELPEFVYVYSQPLNRRVIFYYEDDDAPLA